MDPKADRGGVTLALGDLLTVEDPVWVWDIRARKILWANRAGQAFWGAEGLDALRERRFPARSSALTRIAALAGESARSGEWTERLAFPGRGDRQPVTCYMQSLQVAGGQPGVIVRALDAPEPREEAPLPAPAPVPDKKNARPAGEAAALAAIATQLGKARGALKRSTKPPAKSAPPPPAATTPPPVDAHAALIRELCHELRNPLTVIIGFAERIRDADGPRAHAKTKAYAENILEGAGLALDILCDFSTRLREGAPMLGAPATADVKASVESCLRLIAPLAAQGGLILGKSLGRELPRLKTEERALKQMLLNVLLNAVRHQRTGGQISVRARRRRDGGLMIAISDDGVGMTKKAIKAALAGKPRPVSATGAISGLGLPLVKRLAEAAGGTIAIESARGKGTTVELAFPAGSLVAGA